MANKLAKKYTENFVKTLFTSTTLNRTSSSLNNKNQLPRKLVSPGSKSPFQLITTLQSHYRCRRVVTLPISAQFKCFTLHLPLHRSRVRVSQPSWNYKPCSLGILPGVIKGGGVKKPLTNPTRLKGLKWRFLTYGPQIARQLKMVCDNSQNKVQFLLFCLLRVAEVILEEESLCMRADYIGAY
jgi:hypothetical protein